MRDNAKLFRAILDNHAIVEKHRRKTKIAGADECWLWQFGRNQGYGDISFLEVGYPAHRVAYMAHYRENPGRLFVLHKCDTPLCQNPAHLFLGTAGDNNRDRSAKGRTRTATKLTAAQVSEIKKLSKTTGSRKLAKLFSISRGEIRGIERGTNWKHVT